MASDKTIIIGNWKAAGIGDKVWDPWGIECAVEREITGVTQEDGRMCVVVNDNRVIPPRLLFATEAEANTHAWSYFLNEEKDMVNRLEFQLTTARNNVAKYEALLAKEAINGNG